MILFLLWNHNTTAITSQKSGEQHDEKRKRNHWIAGNLLR